MAEGSPSPAAQAELRVVVDAQLVLSSFLVRRDQPAASPSTHLLLRLLRVPRFSWLWTPDIVADYARGAGAIEQDARIMRRAAFDRLGFRLLVAALQLQAPVGVSVTTLGAVRRQIAQTAHVRQRDLDDAIYVACAVDGHAQVLTSNDTTLLSLGSSYAGVRIVPWHLFREEVRAAGFFTPTPGELPA